MTGKDSGRERTPEIRRRREFVRTQGMYLRTFFCWRLVWRRRREKNISFRLHPVFDCLPGQRYPRSDPAGTYQKRKIFFSVPTDRIPSKCLYIKTTLPVHKSVHPYRIVNNIAHSFPVTSDRIFLECLYIGPNFLYTNPYIRTVS